MIDKNKISPEHLWYVIGLIATDGNLSKDGRHINITSRDREYIISIRKILGLKVKIVRKSRGKLRIKLYSFLEFSDVNFYRFLLDVGLTPRKSLTLGKLKIEYRYFVDFLRGVIDGDGAITSWVHRSNGHRQWSLRIVSGSQVFIRWLKTEIERYFDVSGKLYGYRYKSKRNYIFILKFGKLVAQNILRKVYYSDSLSLNRKQRSVILCLQDKSKMVNYRGILRPGAETR